MVRKKTHYDEEAIMEATKKPLTLPFKIVAVCLVGLAVILGAFVPLGVLLGLFV